MTGTILERTAEKGELVTSGFASAAEGGPQGSVVSLADLNDLQVELDIAQDDFAKLGPKQKGAVTVDAYPDRKYDGVIAEISPEANRPKATVQVKVQILNPDAYLAAGHERYRQVPGGRDQAHEFAAAGRVCAHAGDSAIAMARNLSSCRFDGKAMEREVKILSQRSGGGAWCRDSVAAKT